MGVDSKSKKEIGKNRKNISIRKEKYMAYTNLMTDAVKLERAKQQMEDYVKDGYKIFMDTCSLLTDAADTFWQNIIPFLQTYGTKVIIPMRCGQELEKHAGNAANPELAQKAKHTLKIVNQLISAGYVEIRGEASDNFADNVFLTVFTKFRIHENLLLITQDRGLTRDVLKLNDVRSVRGYPVEVMHVNARGSLSRSTPY
jgi:hypothetical protein